MMTTEMTARPGSIEGTRNKLVTDLRGVVDDADHLLKEVANSTAAEFAAARSSIGARLTDARYRIDGARAALTDRARFVADVTQEYVQENPWRVLGVTAAVAVLVGVLISRR
ncbi:MAG: DUF883 domain-containing protein [Candidatus Accumulibacter sp.]|jgi:ElaB/YqjD/DUF883 family membrane-anchored ribosome-binding protein|uniref:DUF883 family protein n=2 Tax=Betaproteobacteria incertae sedis TaxID=119066 RepID=UPI002086621A|nr:DUF883 family protein [Accumulibacter sp.]MBK8578498.1 DUF883 domain-containing protein [Candidatus Accumulibacter propinquus]